MVRKKAVPKRRARAAVKPVKKTTRAKSNGVDGEAVQLVSSVDPVNLRSNVKRLIVHIARSSSVGRTEPEIAAECCRLLEDGREEKYYIGYIRRMTKDGTLEAY